MRSLFELFARLARCSSGSALVEMTIIIPVALSLMAGGVDFGMALSTQATLAKSVRDAARYLGGLPASAYCQTWATSYAKSLVTTTLPSAIPSVDCSTSVIVVSATFPYNSIIVGTFCVTQTNCTTFGTFTLSAQHEERQVGG
jgi:Flp pilus assembly protein TadG